MDVIGLRRRMELQRQAAPGRFRAWSEELYRTLNDAFKTLPDRNLFLPLGFYLFLYLFSQVLIHFQRFYFPRHGHLLEFSSLMWDSY